MKRSRRDHASDGRKGRIAACEHGY